MKTAIVVGTRPEIIKMCPIIRYCEMKNSDYFIIHSGQHYSYNMDQIFFEELKLPSPKYSLAVGSGTHGSQTACLLEKIEQIFLKEKPNVVLVQGDTNSVLAGALAAAKLNLDVGHVEACLRSYDKNMPEEINRVMTDHISTYLFAPTEEAKLNGLKENLPESKIFVTGNTIVDSVLQNLELAKNYENIFEKANVKKNNYFLLTMHRQENVDDKEKLQNILRGIGLLYERFNLEVVYPIHPRTEKMLRKFNLSALEGLVLIPPVSFLEFLNLEKNARLILTDSGGVQEESCILKVPCVTLRENTERPETIKLGSNILSGTNPQNILECCEKMIDCSKNWSNPFGDGKSAERIMDILQSNTIK